MVLATGLDPKKIELHHHDVDGQGETTFDWEITPAYVQAVADHLNLPLISSWREGGLFAEMNKINAPSGAITYRQETGEIKRLVNPRAPHNTRLFYPQKTNDLKLRWCSSFSKIDVLRQLINNSERFLQSRTLVITGERREESAARSRYDDFFPHHCDTRNSPKLRRHVDHWRPILDWTKRDVWSTIEKSRIRPHPAYSLGWGRLSCRTCIFSSKNQWATIRYAYPKIFAKILDKEISSGKTITNGFTVAEMADQGIPYKDTISNKELARFADQKEWTLPIIMDPWILPPGAFGEMHGPS
jgi:3'-phosphoadenosine 5'-phosphosulfate sulfotransferase (PAPS reductase)/FAD synthetase